MAGNEVTDGLYHSVGGGDVQVSIILVADRPGVKPVALLVKQFVAESIDVLPVVARVTQFKGVYNHRTKTSYIHCRFLTLREYTYLISQFYCFA